MIVELDKTGPPFIEMAHRIGMAVAATVDEAHRPHTRVMQPVELVADDGERAAAWQRFLTTPAPAGFDPAIHPDWDDHRSPTFGVWRLHPTWLRVMPGTLMTAGTGEVWTWRRAKVGAR